MNDPNLFVRVSDPTTGDHLTVTRAYAEEAELPILEGRPTVDRYGRLLPRKPHAKHDVATPITPTTEDDTSADTEEHA